MNTVYGMLCRNIEAVACGPVSQPFWGGGGSVAIATPLVFARRERRARCGAGRWVVVGGRAPAAAAVRRVSRGAGTVCVNTDWGVALPERQRAGALGVNHAQQGVMRAVKRYLRLRTRIAAS